MSEITDDETLGFFVEESKEHLESIESDLLDIEQHGEDIDIDLVNKVFRAAHSIKGSAAFMGLEKIRDLGHKIENVLDQIRKGQLIPEPAVVNIILKGFDFLGEMLNDVSLSNDVDITEHLEALESVFTGCLPESEKESVTAETSLSLPGGEVSFSITGYDLNKARYGGNNIYILTFDLINDVEAKDKTPLSLMRDLRESGMVLGSRVEISADADLDKPDPFENGIPFYVLFASIIEEDLVKIVFDIEEKNIFKLLLKDASPAGDSPDEKGKEEVSGKERDLPPEKEVNKKNSPAFTAPDEKKEVTKNKKIGSEKTPTVQQASVRVQVQVLDQLMNRAGELVLARNQLALAIASKESKSIDTAGQRINLVTSEIQETIMLTRMQPVANIFNKFPRVVRDLAKSLGKEITLELEGREVELDKTIIEGLGDPLTHLVRNSADHGIESVAQRKASGKPPEGKICLRAYHESGKVNIEIEDDGKGLDLEKIMAKAIDQKIITREDADKMPNEEKFALILQPGFSTAEQVTEVSGRGVGMDVVKNNLEKLGGQLEINSTKERGSIFRIRLPLTLAIIPSILVSSCEEAFAIAQVSVNELLHISAGEIGKRVKKVGAEEVLVLRGDLIPLVHLARLLKLHTTFFDPEKSVYKTDRRAGFYDERLPEDKQKEIGDDGEKGDGTKLEGVATFSEAERRSRRASNIHVVVVQTGNLKFGLVVEKLHDTMEIVVKPLGRHLKNCNHYAGATIMGDGRVALILDAAGVASIARLRVLSEMAKEDDTEKTKPIKKGSTRETLLLFYNGSDEYCAVPLHLVVRVEEIKVKNIEIMGGKKVVQYRGGHLPVYALEEVVNVSILEERESLTVIIFMTGGHEVGLLAVPPLDVMEEELVIDRKTLTGPGISGTAIIRGHTTLIIDIFEFVKELNPGWFEEREFNVEDVSSGDRREITILLAEDSGFFRAQVGQFLVDEGYTVIEAENGSQAWDLLQVSDLKVQLVITDIEMPGLDGFELARRIKSTESLAHLPIIALTALVTDIDRKKGKDAGFDDYQPKLDKEKLLQCLYRFTKKL